MIKSLWPAVLAVFFSLAGGMPAAANLVIVPTWDSTITSDPNAATIKNTITNLIAVYEASFSDPVTVTITFAENQNVLGESSTYYNQGIAYATVRAALVANATTANDRLALAHLPNTATNPVNGSTTMELTLPNGRALNIGGSSSPPGQTDGTIYLGTSIMNLTRTNINPNNYDLYAVAAHEIDEVLGLSSALDGLTNGAATPTGDVDSMDLFRYNQTGQRSFNTTASTLSYFSLNGTNLLVGFNQYDGGDFHDWYSYPYGGVPPRIQDAYGTPGVTPNFNVELIALDVIGYHFLIPSVAIAKAGTAKETVSWSPATPGFYLVENTNLLTTNWLATVGGTNTSISVTNTVVRKFYRVFHP
jgi:hypothetical protein